jgi:hypothetical protein
MKTYYRCMLALGILVSFIEFAQAQSVYFRPYSNGSYGERDVFPARGVADDYGPRRHAPINWHGGIDYNDPAGDYGHLLLAPFSGTIADVNGLLGPGAPNSKEIALDVGAYRYLFIHVFYNSQALCVDTNKQRTIIFV